MNLTLWKRLLTFHRAGLRLSGLAFFLVCAGSALGQTLPPVIDRYERLLERSPGKGTAFDKVYQYFFEGEGLEKLAARWTAQAEASGADAATYWLLLGVLAERQGKMPEAIRLYQKAAELKPADAHIWGALGDAQVAAGNLPEAVKALQKALASNPTPDLRPPLFRQLARVQQRSFDNDGALKTWQQFIAESPDDPFVIEEAADAMADAERFAEARTQYQKLRDLGGTDPYRRVMATMKLAQLEEKQGHGEQARKIYESALPLASPASWMHREVRARIEENFRREDDLPGLVKYYEESLAKQARDVDVALRLSDALIELNRKSEAVKWLRQAGEWAPDRDEVQVALGKRLGEIDQPREAVTILAKLVQAHPEEESYREFLGDAQWQVFKKEGDEASKKAAIESWRLLAPATAKEASQASRVADIFRVHELPAETLEFYARAVSLAPDVPELRQRWAEYLFEQKRNAEASEVLRDMVAGERATAGNFLRLARLQQRREDYPAALDSVQKGLAKEPANFELLMQQWHLFAVTNQWEQAVGLFGQLLAVAPSVYSIDQVEDQQVQALSGAGRLEEVTKQLAGRIGKEPALSEADLRLLLRITLQGGDLDAAGEAITEAAKRFPASASLVRRRVEYEKRKGNLEGRVAALRRLVELQPKQKVDWLREIVRAYQDEGRWDEALTAVQAVVTEAPASPDSYLLASDINFAAQRFDAGVAKLREAIRLSDRPNDLRLHLAHAFLEAGRGEEARQTYDAAFEAESDPKVRLALTRQLAEVYMQQGKLDDLIGRFRQRQRAEEGGWRYALYLAEIFQQMQDFTAAREELSKALGARSRDGNFLRQLMQLSEAEGNMAERARFARLLAAAEPGEGRQIELASALIDNGEMDDALKVLRTNEEGFSKNPLDWRPVLLKFHGAGAGESVAGILREALERRTGDWRGRLTLAEMGLGMEDWAGAERWLWEILALPPEIVSPPPASAIPAAGPVGSPFYPGGLVINGQLVVVSGGGGGGASKYLQRVSRGFVSRQNLAMIFAGQGGGMRRGRYSRSFSYGGMAQPQASIGSLEEAKDTALIYLAVLAQQQNRGEAFLAELEKRLARASRADRIISYALIQAPDLLRRELEVEAAHSSGDPELDAYCLQTLIGMIQADSRKRSADDGKLALIKVFLARERRPEELLTAKISYANVLLQKGLVEEAKRVADEVLGQAETAGIDTLPLIFGFAIEREDFPVAEKALPRLLAASQQPGQAILKQQISWYRFSLASGLIQKKESMARGVHLLAEMLKESYPRQLPQSFAALSPYTRQSYRAAWSEGQQFPYANRYFDDARIQMWQQIFQRLKTADALEEVKGELNRHIQSLPDDQTVYAQLARACFWWWDGAKFDAINEVRQLAHDLADDDLRMMVSSMLAEAGKPADALQALEEVTATTGDAGIDKQVRMLLLARAANDLERAKDIALKLTQQRLGPNDESQVISILNQLGLTEKAQELMKRQSGTRGMGSQNRIEQQLERQMEAKNGTEALALARAILARDPLASMLQNQEYVRSRAIQALRTFKALDAYRAELERQLADAPSSVRTVYLLAEACEHDHDGKALGYYRKLVELKPMDSSFQLRLAGILLRGNQPEEAMRIWEGLLERDPDPVMQEAFSQMIEVYKKAGQMTKLGVILTKLPKRPASPAAMFNYGAQQMYGAYFNQVAAELQNEGKTPEAIGVWRAALAQQGEASQFNDSELIARLAAALIEVGDNVSAAAEIERFFFPERKPQALFAFDSAGQGPNWMQITSHGDGHLDLPALGLLRLARQAGGIDRLRAKAVSAASEGNEWNGQLVLLIDALRRDAGSVGDFSARVREAMQPASKGEDGSSLPLFQVLAQELREWPEGKKLALEVMLSARDALRKAQNEGYEMMIDHDAADLAVELGETETARTVLREWQASMRHLTAINRFGIDYRQQILMMELMGRVGLAQEARAVLKDLRTNPQTKNDAGARQKLDDFENRLALLAGEAGRARLTMWSEVGESKDAPTVLYWEIGQGFKSRGNNGSNANSLSVTGEELSVLNGRYEIDIFYGRTPSSMQKIAALPGAKARGSWSSAAALGAGYFRAEARDKASVLFSAPAFVFTGSNLLLNPQLRPASDVLPKQQGAIRPPAPGWQGLGANSVIPSPGGPRPGGDFVRLQPINGSGREVVTSQRIPIEPAKEYLLTGWIRYRENTGMAQISAHFYDKDGKAVGQISMNPEEGDRWFKLERWLTRTRGQNGAGQLIPEKAVEMDLTLELNSNCDLDGLYVGEVIRGSSALLPENE